VLADEAGADPAVDDPPPLASEPLEVVGALDPVVPSVPAATGVSVVVAAAVDDGALERLASRASFLAQPEPLNRIAGADRARFMVPPQRSQVVGPDAEMPWMTSTTCPHDSQT
jgi:hypothetical protein